MYYICILTLLQWIVPSFSDLELNDNKIPVHRHSVAQEFLCLLLSGVSNQVMMAPNFTSVMVSLKNREKPIMAIIIHLLSLYSSQNSDPSLMVRKGKSKSDYFKPLCKSYCSLCSTVSSAMSTTVSSNSAGSAVVSNVNLCRGFLQS